jgi:hypothetical protein
VSFNIIGSNSNLNAIFDRFEHNSESHLDIFKEGVTCKASEACTSAWLRPQRMLRRLHCRSWPASELSSRQAMPPGYVMRPMRIKISKTPQPVVLRIEAHTGPHAAEPWRFRATAAFASVNVSGHATMTTPNLTVRDPCQGSPVITSITAFPGLRATTSTELGGPAGE